MCELVGSNEGATRFVATEKNLSDNLEKHEVKIELDRGWHRGYPIRELLEHQHFDIRLIENGLSNPKWPNSQNGLASAHGLQQNISSNLVSCRVAVCCVDSSRKHQILRITRQSACPSIDQLCQFVADELAVTQRNVIEEHLAQCDACSERVTTLANHTQRFSHGKFQSQAHEAVRIPGYCNIRELHRGGQGVVYAATQESTDRPVAIKVMLRGRYATTKEVIRFQREISLAAKLDHPNIVTVFDSGILPDGQLFLVMQLIDGLPIDKFIAQCNPTIETRLDIFRTIVDAVATAHQRGIIHRDLKPGNILIDAAAQPHLLDFGLARSLEAAGLESEQKGLADQTRSGTFCGTLFYAPPEHLQDDDPSLDVRSDVYSLGVLLFEMITGELPYRTDGGIARVMRRITQSDPIRPHTLQAISPDLEAIILKAIEKKKAARYQSVRELAQDLDRLRNHRPVKARTPTRTDYLLKFVARNKLLVTGAALATCVLIGGIIAITASSARARVAEHQATARLKDAQLEAARAQAYSEFLKEMILSADADFARGRDTTVLQDMLDEFAAKSFTELDDLPEVKASVQLTLGTVYHRLSFFQQADELLSSALVIHRSLPDADMSIGLSDTLAELATVRLYTGENAESIAMLRESLAIRKRVYQQPHHEIAMGMAWLTNALAQSRLAMHMPEADTLSARALEICRAVSEDPSDTLAACLLQRARVLTSRDRFDEAEEVLHELLAVREQLYVHDSQQVASCILLLGRLYRQTDRLDLAHEYLSDGLATRRKLLGPRHLALVWPATELAWIECRRENFQAAEQHIRDSLDVARANFGNEHVMTHELTGELAMVLERAGQHDGAAALYREALGGLYRVEGSDSAKAADLVRWMAELNRERGQ